MNYLKIIFAIAFIAALPGVMQASENSALVTDINRYFGELARAHAYKDKGDTQNAQETFERAKKQLEGIKQKLNSPRGKKQIFDYVSQKLPRIKTTAGGVATDNLDEWLVAEQAALDREIESISPRSRTESNAAPMSPVASQGEMSPTRRMTASEQGVVRLPVSPVVRPTSSTVVARRALALSPSTRRAGSPGRKVTFVEPEDAEKKITAACQAEVRATSPSVGRRMPPPPPLPPRVRSVTATGTTE